MSVFKLRRKSRTLDRVDRFFLTAYIATLAFVYIALIIAL